jgi:hydrogenase maturation protease
MARTVIIAFGNPLRCDDGLAWHVAEELSRLDLPANVEIITRHQLTPELALSVSQASSVLFIDAARDGVPGELVCAPLRPQRQSSVFTHEFSPATILSLAQDLYGARPTAFTISLCGQNFDHGETLSPKVVENLPRVLAQINELRRSFMD